MVCHLIHCDGHKVIREVIVDSFSELPALCRIEENKFKDDYCIYAKHDNKIVADAEGIAEAWQPDPIYQAGIAYACGYHD